MAFKLTKAERAALDELERSFSATRTNLTTVLEEILDEWQAEFDERSEKWKEGEAGQEAEGRLNTLQEMIDNLDEADPLPLDDLM